MLSLAGCLDGPGGGPSVEATPTLATGTTAYGSGRLDILHPGPEEAFGAAVEALTRGTGRPFGPSATAAAARPTASGIGSLDFRQRANGPQ